MGGGGLCAGGEECAYVWDKTTSARDFALKMEGELMNKGGGERGGGGRICRTLWYY